MFQGLGFRVDDLWFGVDILSLDYLTICFFFVKINQTVINAFH